MLRNTQKTLRYMEFILPHWEHTGPIPMVKKVHTNVNVLQDSL